MLKVITMEEVRRTLTPFHDFSVILKKLSDVGNALFQAIYGLLVGV